MTPFPIPPDINVFFFTKTIVLIIIEENGIQIFFPEVSKHIYQKSGILHIAAPAHQDSIGFKPAKTVYTCNRFYSILDTITDKLPFENALFIFTVIRWRNYSCALLVVGI